MGGKLRAMQVQPGPAAAMDLGSFIVRLTDTMSFVVMSHGPLTISKPTETARKTSSGTMLTGTHHLLVSGSSIDSTDKLLLKFYWE